MIYNASPLMPDKEVLCEAGVFTLAPLGWSIFRRKKFSQLGAARDWAESNVRRLQPLEIHCFWIISTAEDGQTLESVLKRCRMLSVTAAGPLSSDLIESQLIDADTEKSCDVYVCVEAVVDGQRESLIAARKTFHNLHEAHRWAAETQREYKQCGIVTRCETFILPCGTSDDQVMEAFHRMTRDNPSDSEPNQG